MQVLDSLSPRYFSDAGQIKGPQGETGERGVGISSTEIKYQEGTSGTVAPTGTWLDSVPAVTAGNYLWTRRIDTLTNGTTTSPAYSVAMYGNTGPKGSSITTSVARNAFTEYYWNIYGTYGHAETWTDTSSIRNGCRVDDLFTVCGTATDTGIGHTLTYICDNSYGDLHGTCISHVQALRGTQGPAGTDANVNWTNICDAIGVQTNGHGIYKSADGTQLLLDATAGKIANWTITQNALGTGTCGTADSMFLSPTGVSASGSIGGSETGKINWAITSGVSFGVDTTGALYSTSGKIGGLTINSDGLSYSNIFKLTTTPSEDQRLPSYYLSVTGALFDSAILGFGTHQPGDEDYWCTWNKDGLYSYYGSPGQTANQRGYIAYGDIARIPVILFAGRSGSFNTNPYCYSYTVKISANSYATWNRGQNNMPYHVLVSTETLSSSGAAYDVSFYQDTNAVYFYNRNSTTVKAHISIYYD